MPGIGLSFDRRALSPQSRQRKEEDAMDQPYRFKVLYEKCHDGSYRAWVPALPACQASGSSMAQTRSRITEAVRCYCLNMLENGATIPRTPPGQPAVVDEIQINLGAK